MLSRSLRPMLLMSAAIGLAASFGAAPLSGQDPETRPTPRPNIVFLLADDLGWSDVGWRDPELRTPRLDALRAESAELSWHYVQPQCTPTRVAWITGRYPSRFNDHCVQASNERAFPAETQTLPRLLSSVGYQTFLTGKWHLGSTQEAGPQHHFDRSYGSLAGAVGMYDHRYRLNSPFAKTWHRDGDWVEEPGHVTDICTDEAIRYLRERDTERPFLLYVPFHAVHVPLVEEQRWMKQNEHIGNPDRRLFGAAVTHLDHAVGRILDELDKQGIAGETLVVFTSDNGGLRRHRGGAYPPPDSKLDTVSSNAPLRGWKTDVFEGGMRVPTLVRWPAQIEPGTRGQVCHMVDWMPTLLGLADVEAPSGDGQSVHRPLLDPDAPVRPRRIYWKWSKKLALRDGDWKLVRNRGKGGFLLFNLSADPNETTDLREREPEQYARMLGLLREQIALDAKPMKIGEG